DAGTAEGIPRVVCGIRHGAVGQANRARLRCRPTGSPRGGSLGGLPCRTNPGNLSTSLPRNFGFVISSFHPKSVHLLIISPSPRPSPPAGARGTWHRQFCSEW